MSLVVVVDAHIFNMNPAVESAVCRMSSAAERVHPRQRGGKEEETNQDKMNIRTVEYLHRIVQYSVINVEEQQSRRLESSSLPSIVLNAIDDFVNLNLSAETLSTVQSGQKHSESKISNFQNDCRLLTENVT